MDFEESEAGQALRQLTRKFALNEIAPHIAEDEKAERFRPEWIAKMGELGLTGVPIPEEYGGAGLGYQEYAIVIEELAATGSSYSISVAVTGLPQVTLAQAGTEEQRKRFLPKLCAGKAIGAFALSEAGSGSDAGSLRTSAVLQGDHYVVNGTKQWITQGDSADVILLMARTGGPGPKGVSAFILEKGMPGFSCGKREHKMGANASHTMELVLENVKIPVANRIGNEGDGFRVAMNALNGGRITIAATACGIARSALEVATHHARERKQFGQSIGEFQGVSFLLADMAAQLDASRLLVQRAAWLKDNDKPYATEASMAKLIATDMAMKVTTDAVQILGGSGYTQEFPVERYMREAKVLQIVEGTNQVQRMIIGKALLAGQR